MINKKGQAAATDALIFLGIVSVVFVMIIGYTMNYGTGILGSAKKLYMSNYEFTALKVFFTADYGRDGISLSNNTLGMDSVAIMIKEDYGTIGTVSSTTKQAMFGVLDSIFLPLPQRSYLMYIQHEVGGSVMVPLVTILRTVDEDGKKLYYDCSPLENIPIVSYLGMHSFDLEVAEGKFLLFKNVADKFCDTTEPYGCDMKKEDGIIYLASWISAPETIDLVNSDFKCAEVVLTN